MTATRRAATIAALVVAWVLAAALLWRTRVPGDVSLPSLHPRDYFTVAELRRSRRYESFLRVDLVAELVGQIGAVAGLALVAPRLTRRVRGGAVARGVQLALATFVLLWAVQLAFGLAAHWWRRRYGIVREGYLDFVVRPWSTVLAELVLVCVAVAALMVLATRFGSRWWIAGAGVVAMLGTAYVVVQPLVLTPRFAPLREPTVRAEIETLARRVGAGDVEVRLRKAHERTRAVNAELVGIGPTRRLVLWDTLLEGRFDRREIRVLAAHELAHVTRRHIWKGLGWFLLAVVPGVWVIDRAARLRGGLARPEAVPVAIAAGFALALGLTPAIDAVSRRYEAEADWIALQTTRDPAAMRGLLQGLAATNLADPDPPRAWQLTFETHPSVMRRIAMAEAWARRYGHPLPPPQRVSLGRPACVSRADVTALVPPPSRPRHPCVRISAVGS
jgi:STE24 endopeptidase